MTESERESRSQYFCYAADTEYPEAIISEKSHLGYTPIHMGAIYLDTDKVIHMKK